jgi:NAD dependent epimerase/dehydratase family enzyme
VLAPNGGALPELTRTIPLGVASYFSKDNLYYPWIHIDDVCGIMIHALENENVSGAHNTTAPRPLPMKNLMQRDTSCQKIEGNSCSLAPLCHKTCHGRNERNVIKQPKMLSR